MSNDMSPAGPQPDFMELGVDIRSRDKAADQQQRPPWIRPQSIEANFPGLAFHDKGSIDILADLYNLEGMLQLGGECLSDDHVLAGIRLVLGANMANCWVSWFPVAMEDGRWGKTAYPMGKDLKKRFFIFLEHVDNNHWRTTIFDKVTERAHTSDALVAKATEHQVDTMRHVIGGYMLSVGIIQSEEIDVEWHNSSVQTNVWTCGLMAIEFVRCFFERAEGLERTDINWTKSRWMTNQLLGGRFYGHLDCSEVFVQQSLEATLTKGYCGLISQVFGSDNLRLPPTPQIGRGGCIESSYTTPNSQASG